MDDLQAKLALAKGEYKTALKNLEMISDEIHERRRSTAMGPRGCGVGAEGSNTSVEDLSASKPESDTVSSEYCLLCDVLGNCAWEYPMGIIRNADVRVALCILQNFEIYWLLWDCG